MVRQPLHRTVFDPLKTNQSSRQRRLVRGSIVQGSDLRPPLGIEIKVDGKKISLLGRIVAYFPAARMRGHGATKSLRNSMFASYARGIGAIAGSENRQLFVL